MEGFGRYTWSDGRCYMGQYSGDKKQGWGIYEWVDGRKFKETWLTGKQHGLGTYVLANGVAKVGLWEDGKRLKWYTGENEELVACGDKDFRDDFNSEVYKTDTGFKSTLEMPQEFKDKMDEVKQHFDVTFEY